jgi:hypothetical protein
MKRIFFVLALLAAGAVAAPETEDEVAARRAALDLAGAWSNDGFKLRDGHFSGTVKAGESKLIRVNLYAGNQYWFTAASTKAKKLAMQIFDESGKSVTFEPYQDEGRAAAGFAPAASGPYFIKIEETEGDPSSFVLVYSYK